MAVERSVDTLQPRTSVHSAGQATPAGSQHRINEPQVQHTGLSGHLCALSKQPGGCTRSCRYSGRFWGVHPTLCTSDPSGPRSAALPGLPSWTMPPACWCPERGSSPALAGPGQELTCPQLGPRPLTSLPEGTNGQEATGWHTRQPALRDWRAEWVSPTVASPDQEVALRSHRTTRASVPRATYGRGHGGKCWLHCTGGSVPVAVTTSESHVNCQEEFTEPPSL